jgi:hypothetical protein
MGVVNANLELRLCDDADARFAERTPMSEVNSMQYPASEMRIPHASHES